VWPIAERTPSPVIELREVTRAYGTGESRVLALDHLSLTIERGAFAAITGPSGCGKSTLLHLLGGLDRPDSGSVRVDGIELETADEARLTAYRRHKLGFVFQFFHLLPTLTVRENIELPLLLQGAPDREAATRSAELLALTGMEPRARHFPHQLSGGEMQRTAIARALAHRPSLLLADEPTGNLDSASAARILDLFRRIHAEGIATIVLVTHSAEVAAIASRHIPLRDGKLDPAAGPVVVPAG